MRKQPKKFTQRKKFTPRAATPKDEQAKERERTPGSVEDPALSASARVAKRPSRRS